MPEQRIELKLTPLDERVSVENLPDPADNAKSLYMKWIKDNRTPYFGSIMPFLTSIDFNYRIVNFYPNSAENGSQRKKVYQTTQEALEACFAFLKEKGYCAERIDVESQLSRAGRRRESF